MKTKNSTKRIFITWGRYGTRASSLANAIKAREYFIGVENRFNNLFLSSLTYFYKSFINLLILIKHRPKVVIVTNTQWVVAAFNLFYCKLFKKKLIFDSHSCAFDNHKLRYPLSFSIRFAQLADLSIVTNKSHQQMLESNKAHSVIIKDIPFDDELKSEVKVKLSDKFNLLYICIFAEDEPYLEVLNAARRMPDVQIYVTGNYKRAGITPEEYPEVKFSGFIPQEEYVKLLNSVDAIMTLTTRENTMQRGGSEAISVCKPLITSNTKMLKEYFVSGTVFVENEASSIIKGIKELKNNLPKYSAGILEMKEKRKAIFEDSIKIIEQKLKEKK